MLTIVFEDHCGRNDCGITTSGRQRGIKDHVWKKKKFWSETVSWANLI